MEYLDLKGMNCPLPVIETKKLLDTRDVNQIEVLVDSETACENVRRLLESKGFAVTTDTATDGFVLRGTSSTKCSTPVDTLPKRKLLVLINSETLGGGSDELGRILMRSFLATLKDLDEKPWRIIFINSGVKLVVETSECLNILKQLEGLTVEILSCGTCLDYFQLTDNVVAGRVTNMYDVVSSFLQATHVISP